MSANYYVTPAHFAKCSSKSFNPYEMSDRYHYNPYMVHARTQSYNSGCAATTAPTGTQFFNFDGYSDDSDDDSQPETPVTHPSPAKPVVTSTKEDKECNMTPTTQSPRSSQDGEVNSPDPSTDAESFHVESDAEEHSQESDADAPHGEELEVFSQVDLLKFRHAVPWLDGIEDRCLIAMDTPQFGERKAERGSDKPQKAAHKATRRKSTKAARRKGSASDQGTSSGNASGCEELCVSESSWLAQQRAHRSMTAGNEAELVSDEEVMRSMKSILNKLTVEKFSPLCEKLLSCGIQTRDHLDVLIGEVFEKATTQHNFINMYADLCALLNAHFVDRPIVDDPDASFKEILFNNSQEFFEECVMSCEDTPELDEDDRIALGLKYKMQMLGNVKFVGALLVRELLSVTVLFSMCSEFLTNHTPESLELLAALLTMVGPKFDTPELPSRSMIAEVFEEVEELVQGTEVTCRIRFLLKDVLELRATHWEDRKAKKVESPSTLREVADTQAAEEAASHSPKSSCTRCQAKTSPQKRAPRKSSDEECAFGRRCTRLGCWHKHPEGRLIDENEKLLDTAKKAKEAHQDISSMGTLKRLAKQKQNDRSRQQSDKQPLVSSGAFPSDRGGSSRTRLLAEPFRKEMSDALAELRTSHDAKKAVLRMSDFLVPPSQQPEELCNMLVCMVQEGSAAVRKLYFEMAAGLVIECHWKPKTITNGLRKFLEDVCPGLKSDVPNLSEIIWEELHPALSPLASKS